MLLKRFNLIFVQFGVFLGECHLHLLFDLQHLDLLYHSVQFLYQFLLLLQVERLLRDADLAGLYLLHHLYLLISICTNLRVFLFDLTARNQKSRLQLRDRLVAIELDLTLLDADLHLEVRLRTTQEVIQRCQLRLLPSQILLPLSLPLFRKSQSLLQNLDPRVQLSLLSANVEPRLKYLKQRSLGDVVGLLQNFDLSSEEVEISCLLCRKVLGLDVLERVKRHKQVLVYWLCLQ